MRHDVAADDMFHDFGNDTCQADGSVIGTQIFLSFLEYRYNIGPAPVDRYNSIAQRSLEENRQWFSNLQAQLLQYSGTEVVTCQDLMLSSDLSLAGV